jgi:hypothetical protein
MILFVNSLIIFMSFLIVCFMEDNPWIVNYILRLYHIHFLFAQIKQISFSFIVCRSWYALFGKICRRQKAWKILFNFIWIFLPNFTPSYNTACIFDSLIIHLLHYVSLSFFSFMQYRGKYIYD